MDKQVIYEKDGTGDKWTKHDVFSNNDGFSEYLQGEEN